MMEGLDPLAQTATATPEQGAKAGAEMPVSIARFRIERQIGAGAMGVVYAAFDPDLERHVAVKVLHAAPGQVARNRLLREARAMARLSHPNVVTVHEVGTSGDRDYVATELIIGSNLSEWLRAAPRSKREIVDAFLAAGRGLVAAHEAGLVHRDFKPHNVLRSNSGRIVVTDFGLARARQGESSPAEVLPPLDLPDDPSSLASELTRTGGLVGTPGYMAPEQWAGLDVDAAADQFSFCVALWEAVAGQRPFLGQTIDELRAQVQRPPSVTNAAAERIPRALRNILMRGLAARPEERFPTMRALIESIEIARRRPRRIAAIAFSVAAVVIVFAAMISAYVTQPGVLGGASCPPPLRRAEDVWSAAKRATMPERIARQFDRKVEAWHQAREQACKSDSSELRRVRSACLDGVMSTIELAVKAMTMVDESTRRSSDVTDLAAWSQGCLEPTVPTVHPLSVERLGEAAALLLRANTLAEQEEAQLDRVVQNASEGCELGVALYVRAVAHLTKASFGREASAAEDAIEACGDDYLRARVAVLRAQRTETPFYGPEQMALLRKATAAVKRVADTAMLSHLDLIRGRAAYVNAAFDTAIEYYQRARELAEKGDDSRATFVARWFELISRVDRGRAEDLGKVVTTARALYGEMVEAYGSASANLWQFREALASLEWRAGNVEESRKLLAEAVREPSRDNDAAMRPLSGRVLDAEGRGVAGVLVLAITAEKSADVDDVDLALWDRATLEAVARTMTKADGTFSFQVATGDVFVLARSAGRAAPVTKVPRNVSELTLLVEPTGSVQGTIDYGVRSRFSTRASVGAGRKGFHFIAPVSQDGRYEVPNVPPDWYEVRALSDNVSESKLSGRRVRIGRGTRKEPVDFGAAQGSSTLDIIVRNERAGALVIAQVYVLRGRVKVTTFKELRAVLDASASTNLALARPVIGERAPTAARQKLRHGDLFVVLEHLDSGEHSVCAVGLSGDLIAEDFVEKLRDAADLLDVRCKSVTLSAASEQVVEIMVPPMLRVD